MHVLLTIDGLHKCSAGAVEEEKLSGHRCSALTRYPPGDASNGV